MGFKIGDVVHWKSQASGVEKEKTGTIVAVVPAGSVPNDIPRSTLDLSKFKHDGFGQARSHDSYLVEFVRGCRKSRLYWPIANRLQLSYDFQTQEQQAASRLRGRDPFECELLEVPSTNSAEPHAVSPHSDKPENVTQR